MARRNAVTTIKAKPRAEQVGPTLESRIKRFAVARKELQNLIGADRQKNPAIPAFTISGMRYCNAKSDSFN